MQRIEKIDSYSVPLHLSKQSRNAILNRNQGHCTKQSNEGIETRARRPSGIKPTNHRELFILHSLTDGTHTRPWIQDSSEKVNLLDHRVIGLRPTGVHALVRLPKVCWWDLNSVMVETAVQVKAGLVWTFLIKEKTGFLRYLVRKLNLTIMCQLWMILVQDNFFYTRRKKGPVWSVSGYIEINLAYSVGFRNRVSGVNWKAIKQWNMHDKEAHESSQKWASMDSIRVLY